MSIPLREHAMGTSRQDLLEEHLEVTQLLGRASSGDSGAEARLADYLYPQLRSLARKQLSSHRRASLCTTDLVHETFLKVFKKAGLKNIADRRHFYLAAARAMRHVLIDAARRRNAKRRGGDWHPVSLDENRVKAKRNLLLTTTRLRGGLSIGALWCGWLTRADTQCCQRRLAG